jgi:plastocyanin
MRTFAMMLVSAAYGVMLVVLLYYFVAFIAPSASDPDVAPFVPIFGFLIAVFGIVGGAGLLWAGARHRAWFWLVSIVPGVLLLLMFGIQITYSLGHPADPSSFIPTLLAVIAALLVIVGSIAAFIDVRRMTSTWNRDGRAGWLVTGLTGILIGAVLTSLLAGSASGGGGTVAEAPTTTGVVTTENTKFVETSLTMKNGEILGLFVINRDAFGHSFDIDSLNIHVQLSPNSTAAVTIKPATAGTLEYYCAVPGHKDAGMVGTLSVE